VVEARQLGELERSLLQRGLFFQFAGEWLQKHAGPIDVLAQRVDTMQDDAYREFVAFVRGKAAETSGSLEPAAMKRQLDSLQKSIGATGASRERSLKELADLRRQLQDEQLDEFRTQKTVLQQDVVEALLGRLTSPSVRLASQLGGDPQVLAALNLAKDVERYQQVLEPDGEDLLGTQPKTSDGRTIVRRNPLVPTAEPPVAQAKPTAQEILAVGDARAARSSLFPPEILAVV